MAGTDCRHNWRYLGGPCDQCPELVALEGLSSLTFWETSGAGFVSPELRGRLVWLSCLLRLS